MSTLSIMIDEAGNFDMSTTCDPLYCITLVFHNQDDDITDAIEEFDTIQRQKGFNPEKAVHVSPLIRKEPPYAEMDKNKRKSLFTATASFIQRLPIKYKAFMFDKKQSSSYNAFMPRWFLLSIVSSSQISVIFRSSTKSAFSTIEDKERSLRF